VTCVYVCVQCSIHIVLSFALLVDRTTGSDGNTSSGFPGARVLGCVGNSVKRHIPTPLFCSSWLLMPVESRLWVVFHPRVGCQLIMSIETSKGLRTKVGGASVMSREPRRESK
jgi:hypothetical protein